VNRTPLHKLTTEKLTTTPVIPATLTPYQYQLLLSLYHEFNSEFFRLSIPVQTAFYTMLYRREG
jgi:hypothetical protein